METKPDVVIVGAGIVGAACAYYLAGAGLRVRVLDESFPGGVTTATGMGHIVVMDDSEPQFALTDYSQRLWVDLGEQWGEYWEDDPCGTLWVATDDEELAHVEAKTAFYRQRGVEAGHLTGRELAELEPELRPGLAGALHVPGDRVIYPPTATRWLIERAQSHGAELEANCRVLELGERVVTTDSGVLEAGLVINAAGAEASRLTPGLPIEPRKGHLVITDRYPGFCRHQMVELGYLKSAHTLDTESVAFNVQPRLTDQFLVGSSRELVGWDRGINRRILRAMLDRAIWFMPRLAELSIVRTWIGFRPTTPDKLPLIGAWPETEGLWIAAGHEGLGITMALGTGRLLSDLILNRPPEIDSSPFDPARVLDGGTTV